MVFIIRNLFDIYIITPFKRLIYSFLYKYLEFKIFPWFSYYLVEYGVFILASVGSQFLLCFVIALV